MTKDNHYTFQGIQVVMNSFMDKDQAIKTEDNLVFMHPYTLANCLLHASKDDYRAAFKILGTTDEAIDMCLLKARKALHLKIEYND